MVKQKHQLRVSENTDLHHFTDLQIHHLFSQIYREQVFSCILVVCSFLSKGELHV